MTNRKYPSGQTDWKATLKQLKGVDEMFEVLERDKQLPRFPEFLIACLVMGNSECVNLKKMFPKHCKALDAWLTDCAYGEA